MTCSLVPAPSRERGISGVCRADCGRLHSSRARRSLYQLSFVRMEASMVNPVLGFNPTFRQLVRNLVYFVEQAPDPEVYLADLENVADDLDTSVYWVEQALDWVERYGKDSFSEDDPTKGDYK